MDSISGIVETITYMNEENGYTVAKIRARGFHYLVPIIGNMPTINIGVTVKVYGSWKNDSKYGNQFTVNSYEEVIPATVEGISKYLGSGLIKGIGPVTAKNIVSVFKDDTIRVIEEEPEKLLRIKGIGKKSLETIKKAWLEQKEIKNIMIFLQEYSVSPAFAVKIFKTYGDMSIEVVKKNPYKLADDIWGIGFRTADKIAQKIGFDKNSYERCRAGIWYVLNELANQGHCYALKEQLTDETIKMLELQKDNVEIAIERMITEKTLIRDFDDCIYLPPFYYSEMGIAKRIKEIMSVKSTFNQECAEGIIDQIEKDCSIDYDEIQKKSISLAVKSKFFILTGGPGTGKTTTTLGIIRAFENAGARVVLAAPTGRAAKRMSEATEMESRTIHRLLEYKPPEGYMRVVENNPLDCDVLIVDEVSMVDSLLMYNLLRAVTDECIVILVGDVDQLPSVGAGNVLRDIIASTVVTVVRLDRIFRQAEGSMIITNAHKINKGIFPKLNGGKNGDFFFIKEDDPKEVAEKIKELCSKRLPNYYMVDPIDDIQVLCPMQRGEVGAYNLNLILQQVLNPQKLCIKSSGIEYKLYDKVMQIKNNYDKNVFNGDIGRITDIDPENKSVIIRYDNQEVEYDISELDEIVLAYASTIHKSQGSEYKIVVAPFCMQHYIMLQRNLLYTCITRAKKIIVLVGSEKAIAMAVRNNKISDRNTMLADITKKLFES